MRGHAQTDPRSAIARAAGGTAFKAKADEESQQALLRKP